MAALLDSLWVVSHIDCIVCLSKLDVLCEVNMCALIHEWLGGWSESLWVTDVNITTENAEVTYVAIKRETFYTFRSKDHISTE